MPVPDDKNASKPSTSSSSSSSSPPPNAAGPRTGNIFHFQASKDVKRFAKKYRTEISAGTSSIVCTVATFPLDFAKSRMQSYKTGFLSTVKDAYKAEGLRAFWRGVLPPTISIVLVRTVSFSLYQQVKYTYDRSIKNMTGQSPLVIANAPGSYPTVSTMACFGAAGATVGAIITTVACPFELTKLNEQLAGKVAREVVAQKSAAGPASEAAAAAAVPVSGGSYATALRLVRDRGFTGLYAGYRLHLLRDTIGTGLYFMTYESAKQLMGNARGKSATSPYAVMFAGGLCGIVSWVCIYPIDVAKTLYQKALLSAGSGYAERPPIKFFNPGAYRGLGVSVARSCILNMLFFSGFEMVKKQINALEVD